MGWEHLASRSLMCACVAGCPSPLLWEYVLASLQVQGGGDTCGAEMDPNCDWNPAQPGAANPQPTPSAPARINEYCVKTWVWGAFAKQQCGGNYWLTQDLVSVITVLYLKAHCLEPLRIPIQIEPEAGPHARLGNPLLWIQASHLLWDPSELSWHQAEESVTLESTGSFTFLVPSLTCLRHVTRVGVYNLSTQGS